MRGRGPCARQQARESPRQSRRYLAADRVDRRRQAQHYYRNSIRSGFVAHSDEDDPEVLQRIYEQSLRDADWILDKVHELSCRPPVFHTARGAACRLSGWSLNFVTVPLSCAVQVAAAAAQVD